jgi:hypothetical protein
MTSSQVQGEWSATLDSQPFLAPCRTYFIDKPLVKAWPCTFSSYTSRGSRGVSPWYGRGRSHLDSTYPATCLRTYPKATFTTTQLRGSVWKPQSMAYTIWDSTSILGQRALVCVSFARLTDSTYSQYLIVGRPTLCSQHISSLLVQYPISLWPMKRDHPANACTNLSLRYSPTWRTEVGDLI